jgi:hypothetical protein
MSILLLPGKSDAERAIKKLKEAEEAFLVALERHEAERRSGGEELQKAATRLTVASRSYRLALLDPRLPPV